MTSFQLPVYQPPAGSWAVTDYKPALKLTAKAIADGTATATAVQVDPGTMWMIQRAVCSTTSTAQTQLRLYEGSVAPANILSGSDSGDYDEADYPLGLLLDQSQQLVAQWAGCNAGDVCTLRLQVAVLSRVS